MVAIGFEKGWEEEDDMVCTYNLFWEMVSLFLDTLNYKLKPSTNKGYAFKHKNKKIKK